MTTNPRSITRVSAPQKNSPVSGGLPSTRGFHTASFLHRLPAAAALLAALAVSLAASRVYATNYTWVNTTGTDWNTAADWNTGNFPGAAGTTDVAIFTGNEAKNPHLSGTVSIGSISFTSTGTNYTISGSAITLGSGVGSATDITGAYTSGTNTISSNLVFGNNAGATVTIQAGGSSGFGVGQGGTLVISGNISSTNAIAGITLGGNSVGIALVLSGSNSYAGNTNIAFQQIDVNNTFALSSGTLLVNNNNTRLNNTSGGAITVANAMKVSGALVFLGNTANNNLTFNGAITMSTALFSITGGGNLILGSGGVTWGSNQSSEGTDDTGNGGNAQGTLTLNGAGSGGGGSITLSSVTYTSAFNLRSGTLALGSSNPFGTGVLEVTANQTSGSGSPVALQASSALGATVITNTILVDTGSFNINGSNNFQSSGSYIKSNAIASGTLNVTNTGTTSLGSLFISDNATSSQTLTINVAGTSVPTIVTGSIANSTNVATTGTGSLVQTGPGLLILTGSSTYTGSTAIQGGTMQIGTGGNLGPSTAVALGSSGATATLVLGDGNGAVNQTIAGLTVASGTGVVVGGNSAVSTLTINNNVTDSYSGALGGAGTNQNNLALTVIGSGTTTIAGVNTYTGATSGSAGLFSLTGTLGSGGGSAVTNNGTFSESAIGVISGSSTFVNAAGSGTLTGTNTYTGSTAVTGGSLVLNGAGSINSSNGITLNGSNASFVMGSSVALTPAITVTQGTLLGTGTVGAVTVTNATGGIVSNGNGNTGALTIGNLTFSGTGAIKAIYGGSPSIVVTGTLGTLNNGTGEITIGGSAASWSSGITNLVSFGTLTGGLSDFSLGTFANLTARVSRSLVLNGNNIALSISGSPDNPVWTGTAGGIWTTAVTGSPTSATPNWVLATAHTTTDFWTTDVAVFNDTYVVGSSTLTPNASVQISGTVNPTSATFNNNSVAYVITGSNGSSGIVGGGSLTMAGSGTTTLGGNNSYTGATSVNAGTLILTGSLNGTPVTTGTGGTFTENATGFVGGASSLTNNGITNISGSNNYSGATTVASGTLALVTSGTLNSTPVTVASGAVFTEDGASAVTGASSLNNSGITSLAGNNSYTGLTTVTSGSLNLTGTLAKTQITVASGGVFNESSAGLVSGSSSLTNNGSANILGSGNNYTGVTSNSGTLQFGDGTTGHDGTISGASISNSGSLVFNYFGNQSYAGAISGAGAVSSIGTGTATLTGANTYTGTTNIGGGATLAIGGAGSLGSGNYAGAITDGGTFTYGSTVSGTFTGLISGTGVLTVSGSTNINPTSNAPVPTMVITGSNTYTGGTILNGGILSIVSGNSGGLGTGQITLNGGFLLIGSSFTMSNNIVLAGGGIFGNDNTKTLSGTITINAGATTSFLGETFDSKTLSISGVLTGTGNVTLEHASLITNGNQGNNVQFISSGSSTYSGTVTIGNDSLTTMYLDGTNALANATINVQNAQGNGNNTDTGLPLIFGANAGSGTTTLTSATIGGLSSGTATSAFGNIALVQGKTTNAFALTVGNNNTNQTYSGVLSGSGSLTKIGTGTQTLSGANSYSGSTAVTRGGLAISGIGANINNSTSVTINGSGASFTNPNSNASTQAINLTQGSANITGTVGAVSVASGSSNVFANGNGGSGVLTMSSLAFGGAATVNVTRGASAPLVVTGALSTNNANGQVTINGSGVWSTGTDNLISYGSFGGTGLITDFTLGSVTGLNSRQVLGSLVLNGNNIALTINGDGLVWTGTASGIWTTGVTGTVGATPNWVTSQGHVATDFWAADNVEFDNTYQLGATTGLTPTTTGTIHGGNVTPGLVTFNNSAVNYTITSDDGSGITGGGGLNMNGSGTTTIATSNNYTGATNVNAGTLILTGTLNGTPIATGTGGTFVENSGGLISGSSSFATAGNSTVSGSVVDTAVSVSATGTFTESGGNIGGASTFTDSGSATLTGSNSYTGATTINQTVLSVGVIANGGSNSTIGASSNGASNLVLNSGTLLYTGISAATNRNFTIGSGSAGTITVSNAATNLTLNGASAATSGTLVINGPGTLTLTANQGNTGGTIVNSGTLGLSAGGGVATVNHVLTINAGAVVNLLANNALGFNTNGTQTTTVNINGGLLNASVNGQEGFSTNFVLTGGTMASSAAQSAGNGYQFQGGAGGYSVTTGSSSALSLISGPINIQNSTQALAFNVAQGSAPGGIDLQVSGIIGGAANAGIQKTGAGTMELTAANTYTGTTTITAGTLQLGDGTTGHDGTIVASPAIVNNASLVYDRFGANSYGGAISGSGSVTMLGSGTQDLSGNSNTYSGNTTVAQGTLNVSNSAGSATGSGTVNVAPTQGAGATLSGTGIISGPVFTAAASGANIAHLAPGVSGAGTLTLGGGLTIGNGTNLDFALGTSQGLIAVTGQLTLGSGVVLNLTQGGGFATNTVYNLLTYTGALTGDASTWTATGAPGGFNAVFSTSTSGLVTVDFVAAGGNDSTLAITPTPVTPSYISLGSVLVGSTPGSTTVTGSNGGVTGTGTYAMATSGSVTSVTPANPTLAPSGTTGLTVSSGTIGGPSGNNTVIGTISASNSANTSGSLAPVNVTANVYEAFSGSTASTINSGTSATLNLTTLANDDGAGGQRAGVTINGYSTTNTNFAVTTDNGGAVGNATGGNNSSTTDVGTVSVANNLLSGTYSYTGNVTGTAHYTDAALQTQGGGSLTNPVWSGITLTGTVSASVGYNVQRQAFVASGSSLAGYGLTSNTGFQSTAVFLNGTTSTDSTVTMKFTATGGHTANPFQSSDTLTLGGLHQTGSFGVDGSVLTDAYVLQLSSTAQGYIAWWDPNEFQINGNGNWVNAIAGNSNANLPVDYIGTGAFAGTYAQYLTAHSFTTATPLSSELGAYGYYFDGTQWQEWAVLDHNSDFEVIPEPGTYAMIFSGFGMLMGFRRLRRRSSGGR